MHILRTLGLLSLALLLAACGSTAATTAPTAAPAPTAIPPAPASDVLSGTTWQLVRLTTAVEQAEIQNPAAYTVTFTSGAVAIVADCNRAAGGYTLGDGTLTIALGPSTLALCPPGSRSEQFLTSLGAVARYFFNGDTLVLEMMADGGSLELRRP